MTTRLHSWWQGRSARERGLLAIMLILSLLLLAWLAVVRPLSDALGEARLRQSRLISDWQQARALAAVMPEAPRPRRVADRTVRELVMESAVRHGVSIGVLRPQDGALSLSVDSAPTTALFAWIASLEAQGLSIEHASVQARDDSTLSAQIVVGGRGV